MAVRIRDDFCNWEVGVTVLDGGLLDNLDVNSLGKNLERRRLSWSHRFVCDMASLLVILLVMGLKEKREAPMLMVASWTTWVSYLPLELR